MIDRYRCAHMYVELHGQLGVDVVDEAGIRPEPFASRSARRFDPHRGEAEVLRGHSARMQAP